VPDSYLNSIHLTADRLEAFREARRALLDNRGTATQQIEAGAVQEVLDGHTPPTTTSLALADAENTYALHLGVNTVGRFHDNHVVVNNPHISRRHCALLLHSSQRCELYDIASKNGTFLNGRRVTGPTPVNPGDEIILHNHRMVLVKSDDPRYAHTYHGVD
jgi:pSer/pThr/pTyr-binding forkhead associated (FHA) protein